ncbi:helix-turn-helix transcriptional regulator [Profundibacter amoris]|nr:helix-turn-helix transcriptional regulator [Profundibacter amoris]
MSDKNLILIALIIQVVCSVFFITDMASTVFGLSLMPTSWMLYELMEISAALGLVIGSIVSAIALRRASKRRQRLETQLKAASGAFMEMLNEKLAEWGLTPAEQDVALFAIKGFSTREISEMRNTSEGTIKAQTNAIYRKAGVSGRPQLLSLFIDDLMGDALIAE